MSHRLFDRNLHFTQGYHSGHKGVDLRIKQGSALYACEDSKVRNSAVDGYGSYYIDLEINPKLMYRYVHLSRRDVKKGDVVKAGQRIGLSGGQPGTVGAGKSTGPHLHFSKMEGMNNFRDPTNYVKAIFTDNSQPPQPPSNNRVKTGNNRKLFQVYKGGWRSECIQEIINAGVWSGTWQENQLKFDKLNPTTPQGGWKPYSWVVIDLLYEPAIEEVETEELQDDVKEPPKLDNNIIEEVEYTPSPLIDGDEVLERLEEENRKLTELLLKESKKQKENSNTKPFWKSKKWTNQFITNIFNILAPLIFAILVENNPELANNVAIIVTTVGGMFGLNLNSYLWRRGQNQIDLEAQKQTS